MYLQAQLTQPSTPSLDYDLYVLDADGNILSGCENITHINGTSGTLPETVGYFTEGTEAATYYLAVLSANGGSANEVFTLDYTVSNACDQLFVFELVVQTAVDAERVFDVSAFERFFVEHRGVSAGGADLVRDEFFFCPQLLGEIHACSEGETGFRGQSEMVLYARREQEVVYPVVFAGSDVKAVGKLRGQRLPFFDFAENIGKVGSDRQVFVFPAESGVQVVQSPLSGNVLAEVSAGTAGNGVGVQQIVADIRFLGESE